MVKIEYWILTGTFTAATLIGSNTFATSVDGGLTWSYGPPIEQIIPLGGTISQVINASLGPGLFFTYAKNGRLYAAGQGFDDMIANPPNQVPMTGFIFTSSDDNGKHWAPPEYYFFVGCRLVRSMVGLLIPELDRGNSILHPIRQILI